MLEISEKNGPCFPYIMQLMNFLRAIHFCYESIWLYIYSWVRNFRYLTKWINFSEGKFKWDFIWNSNFLQWNLKLYILLGRKKLGMGEKEKGNLHVGIGEGILIESKNKCVIIMTPAKIRQCACAVRENGFRFI